MDIRLKENFLNRWKKYFGGAELPITCWYTDDEEAAERAEPAKGHRRAASRGSWKADVTRNLPTKSWEAVRRRMG